MAVPAGFPAAGPGISEWSDGNAPGDFDKKPLPGYNCCEPLQ
jgi:hypothetical protein